ncbi:MAG TPA: single-stranded DNA-binding protein [Chromobacteriaceae bacterium]|nr:single-stranded DNA-binding protein [Chromobacteriaceae bacterium]
MIVIEVETPNVQQREGISAKGTPYKIRNQTCYAHTFDVETGELKKYPTEIKIRLQEDQLPYAAGFYMTSPASIYSDRYDALAIDPVLVSPSDYAALVNKCAARLPKDQKAA